MKHVMIDLETLATSANAVVVSVGAAVFTETQILQSGYWVLDIKEQHKKGRAIAPDTLTWWLKQSDQARMVFQTAPDFQLSLAKFASEFKFFLPAEPVHLWGNGADFDLSIMIDLWQRHGLEEIPSWKYYHHMCYRTFHQLFKCKTLVPREGVHHHAMDDAVHQANCVIASGRLAEFKC